jgi:hypothetical protein
VVDGELAPMMNVGDGVVDGVLQTTETLNPWLSTTDTSLGDGEVRPGATAASVVVRELGKLREKGGANYYSMLQREGRRGGAQGEKGMLHYVGIDGDWRQNL